MSEKKRGGLVLTRKPNQTVLIDGPCEIEIKKVNGNRVIMLFIADKSVRVVRGELSEAKDER